MAPLTDAQIAQLALLIYPDPMLRLRCKPVQEFGPWVEMLARKMLNIMRLHKGVGLAAPQVGVPIRLFVANPTEDPASDRVYVNPELSAADIPARSEEGCLSIPEVNVFIDRASALTLRAVDAEARPFELRSDGLLARVWQHECDHLDGRLIVDYMDTQAELVNRKALKALTQDYKTRMKTTLRRR